MKTGFRSALAACTIALGLAACGGGGGGIGGTGIESGTMRLSITDAPACGYDTVHVTIDRVRVHRSATAGDSDAGWSEVVLQPARRIDLLSLTNGVLETLGQTTLPAGTYTQMRLVLAPNTSTQPLANAVRPTGGAEVPLDTPSGQQTGIKLDVNVDVPPGQVVDVVLDFDACRSVVRRGNSGRYNLKPVISVMPVLSAAGMRIVGWVDPAMAGSGTLVSAQAGGRPVKATVPDAAGQFVLYPVPAGQYDLVVNAAGRVTAVMTGVPVTLQAPTFVNSQALPIAPSVDPAGPRPVSGSVQPALATVRALQSLTGGPTIEVAWFPVDATTGAYAGLLPVAAPEVAPFVAAPTASRLASDPAAAGRYRIEAALDASVKTQDIDVRQAVPPVTFSFP